MEDKKKNKKVPDKKQGTDKFKDKYFDYYDDVKSHTNKVIDW